jgi:pimeloyl-ACP methyl ester carboxylesterase
MRKYRVIVKSLIYSFALVIIITAGYLFFENYLVKSVNKGEHIMHKVISKDGTEIAFIKRGNGPPLILVHGTTAEHSRWLSIILHLEKDFTVYAVDRRGRGGSGDSPDYNILMEVEDISAVINSIDEPVFILGHSYGGLVVLETSLHTNRIKRMILYEPPIPYGAELYPPGTIEKMQKLINDKNNEAALEIMLKDVVQMPDYEFEKYSKLPAYKNRIKLAPTIPREITVELTYNFNKERFADMTVPTLLLLGGDSPYVFREITNLLDKVLPDSRIVEMPGQQHIAMDTNPGLFVNEVRKFLME